MVTPEKTAGREMQATRISAGVPPRDIALPPSRRPYGPGDCVDGKYYLEALIGRGGMGEVWTARNEMLGVRRALKLIRADAGSPESTDRLMHEAQAAARLVDPAIVRVFDFGKTAWGDPYIVMELLDGEDLMSIINRRERLSPTKAVRLLLPMIRALGAAHAHGIVHRDLKPENIFLAKLADGRLQPKLLDFGIAKLKNARDLRLTSAGSVMGSPLYMAPEQARGEDVDERADIWAICVVLYEAITGSPPFPGEDRAQVMYAVAELEPKSLAAHDIADASLWPILLRGLAKARDDRWPSMTELGRALARWLLDGGVIDDITGASLEAGWFRSSRQSLSASSLPPARGLSGLRRAAARALREARPRVVQLARDAQHALGYLRGLNRRQRQLLGAAFGLSLCAGAAWAWLSPSNATPEPKGAAAALPAAAPGVAGNALQALAAPPPHPPSAPAASEEPGTPERSEHDGAETLGEASTSADAEGEEAEGDEMALDETAGEEAASDEAANAQPAAKRRATRAPRRSRRAAKPRASRSTKEDRRSKLIDPYQ